MRGKLNNRGSFTIEAVLVLSVVLLTSVCLLFSFILLYNKVHLMRTATTAAEMAASIWTMREGLYLPLLQGEQEILRESLEGRIDLEEKNSVLLAQVTGCHQDEQTVKLKSIQLYIYNQLTRIISSPRRSTIVITLNNGFLTRNLQVILEQEIKVPFGKLKAFFDGSETITLTGAATSTVVKPTEFIRNVDLTMEYIERLRQGENLAGSLSQVRNLAKSWQIE